MRHELRRHPGAGAAARRRWPRWASGTGTRYFVDKAKTGEHTDELWAEAGKLGYLGVNIPTEYGGGGGGITDLAIVCEELAAAGCPLLLLVVSPGDRGDDHRQARHRRRSGSATCPGIADGTLKIVFAITEPEAGSNFHRLATIAHRDGDDWVLSGRKCFISGVDEAPYVLVVARTAGLGAPASSSPALFVVPTDAPGLTRSKLDMEIVSPENQWMLYLDDVRVPADALIGEDTAAGLPALFSGLNPERITVAAMGAGTARYALDRASSYVATRAVWGRPIGTHQGVAHPLAHAAIQVELARLMMTKAAALYDAGPRHRGRRRREHGQVRVVRGGRPRRRHRRSRSTAATA